jgi:FlaA1/EpsC-like NDP-sugar epimerase
MRHPNARISPLQLFFLFLGLWAVLYYLVSHGRCTASQAAAVPHALSSKLLPAADRYHVLVTGGAGYIGSHAAKKLLHDGHAVTVVDNLSRGNIGSIRALTKIAPPRRFRFVKADLGNLNDIKQIMQHSAVDVVMHFAAVAYVGTFQ